MLLNATAYHRPATVAEALDLLRRPGAALLAGGTELVGRDDSETVDLIDLRYLGLDRVTVAGGQVTIGAMVTLRELESIPELRGLADGILCRAARQAAPATIRAAATLGGTLAGTKGGDELPTALLAMGARVALMRPRAEDVPLGAFLANRAGFLERGLIVGVSLPVALATARGGIARVSRTPADRAIVVAAAVVRPGGDECVAVGGVAPYPRLLDPGLGAWPGYGDHRGSSEYRRWVAPVLVRRAREDAKGAGHS